MNRILIFFIVTLSFYLSFFISNATDRYATKGTDISFIMNYSVSIPMRDNDIKYSAKIWSIYDPNDTLATSQYLIEYTHQSDSLPSFNAYFKGNYYKFENERLQEYHWMWDSIPFKKIDNSVGIYNSGLFAPFMPANIMASINNIMVTTGNYYKVYNDTLINNRRVNAIKLKEYIKGILSKEILYYTNPTSGTPLYYESLNNPNTIGEQLVTVHYDYSQPLEPIDSINEAVLRKRYNAAFSKYRLSNFSIENLPGRKLPMFSLPSTTSEKYTWDGGFKNDAILAFLEVGNGMNKQLIKEVREAIKQSDVPINVLWVYNNRNLEAIYDEMPETRNDEYALIGGKSLATDIGVTGFPTLVFVAKNGIVRDIQLGYNKELKNIVIQKVALMNNQK